MDTEDNNNMNDNAPPIATNAMGTVSRPDPRLAWISIIERLFKVKTLRSKYLKLTNHLRVKRARPPEHTFIDSLRIHSYFYRVHVMQTCLKIVADLLYSSPRIIRHQLSSTSDQVENAPSISLIATIIPSTGEWNL